MAPQYYLALYLKPLSANMEKQDTTREYRLAMLLLRLMCGFWLVMKIISINLWLQNGRTFPLVPIFDFLDGVHSYVHVGLYFISLACMAMIVFFQPKKSIILAIVILEITSCLFDVMRWRPFEYQFICTLVLFLLNRNNHKAFLAMFIFILSVIYIHSGLHKINGGFLYSVWEGMMLRSFLHVPEAYIEKLHYVGLIVPAIEILGGVLLLFMKNKRPGVLLMMGMHLLIICMLGSSNFFYTLVVLLWNGAMLAFLISIERWQPVTDYKAATLNKGNYILLLLWGIMPVLNLGGYWNDYLSSSLYSGKSLYIKVVLHNPDDVPQLQPYLKPDKKLKSESGGSSISIIKWANEQTRVIPYPQEWYYKRLKKKIEERYPNGRFDFYIYRYPYRSFKKI